MTGENSRTLDLDESLAVNATGKIPATQRVRHNISVLGNQLLRRQSVLHHHDTLDVQTYVPGLCVGLDTAALRQSVGILLREGFDKKNSFLLYCTNCDFRCRPCHLSQNENGKDRWYTQRSGHNNNYSRYSDLAKFDMSKGVRITPKVSRAQLEAARR